MSTSSNSVLRLFFLLFASFISLVPGSFSQGSQHGNIWYFGNGAGLDFSSGQPTKLTNINMDSYEGCAVYCDAAGQILLYTNGGGFGPNTVNGPREGIIWNRNQQVMYNMGASEGGGYSAAQSALILPQPGNTNGYYVFTMDHAPSFDVPGSNRGLSCFIVDMSLNGGLGGVSQANIPVFKPAAECLTAIPMAGNSGFWVITIDRDSEDFVVVPVTTSGIGTPVLHPRSSSPNEVLVIKASPDGKFLCADGDVYQFNAATGNLNFLTEVQASNYTLSFSPLSRYLYAFESDASATLVRYDLSATDIPASRENITQGQVFTFPGLMQIGPDHNIYFVEQLEEDFSEPVPPMSLSVIRCPDGDSPVLSRAIMKFETDVDNGGGLFTSLPNFADYIFAVSTDTVSLDIPDIKDTCGALPFVLHLTAPSGSMVKWSDGSTADSLRITEFGTYSVSVTTACGTTNLSYSLPEPVNGCCHPFTPNAFTPNADGVNDLFSPVLQGCDVEFIEFSVYSRWGELMYEGFRQSDRWDGTTLNGTEAPSDVYVYTARYKFSGEAAEKTEKGDVTLLR
ncbi:MAG: gliding motility-associated C-terminal domain-containing protein [Saprospiraceae bacterium]|nr:gliding motility-associated C-terminal domain-containing protein [Saprospiraceae bacterium]